MTSKLSYEDIRRMARVWFNEAREQSVLDDAEIAAWKKERRKGRANYGGPSGFSEHGSSDSGAGDCGGD
jgi:hypothetical protein